jgi:hypothetical protein
MDTLVGLPKWTNPKSCKICATRRGGRPHCVNPAYHAPPLRVRDRVPGSLAAENGRVPLAIATVFEKPKPSNSKYKAAARHHGN